MAEGWERGKREMFPYPVILTDSFKIIFFIYLLFRASPTAHGASQARGPVGAVAARLRQSHSNVGSELRL